jgi:hypothetical protein
MDENDNIDGGVTSTPLVRQCLGGDLMGSGRGEVEAREGAACDNFPEGPIERQGISAATQKRARE